jgi:thioredoxin 1
VIRRTVVPLVVIASVVAGLAVWRSQRAGPAPAAGAAEWIVAGRPTVLDFGRGECGACKAMKPVLDELARRHEGRVTVRILDLKEAPAQALADSMRILLIPSQVFLDASGREVARHEGEMTLDELEAELRSRGWIPGP